MTRTVDRGLTLLAMYYRARGIRISFLRRATFLPPERIWWQSRFHPLVFPLEEGVKWDFLSIFLEDAYLLRSSERSTSRILDIGGNVGFFSVAARLRFPGACIHSYEPNPRVFGQYLRNQATEFGFTAWPEAVGGKCGFVELSFAHGTDTNLAVTVDATDGPIPKISLAEAVERIGGSVDLLKLDCEGAEWEMFLSPEPWQLIKRVTMEYHLFNGESHDAIHSALTGLGYRILKWKFFPECHYGHICAAR